MRLSDILSLSFRTIKGNKLRAGITVAIIAFGIMALIGIITAIEAMNQSLRESFSVLGANAFSITYRDRKVRMGGGNNSNIRKKGEKRTKVSNLDKAITYEQAKVFKENYKFPSNVGIQLNGPRNILARYENKETNPTLSMLGGDENYLAVSGYAIQQGRNLSKLDVETGRNVCLIGYDIAVTLFGKYPEKSVDRIIRISGVPYRVIGLLKSKGSSAMLQMDKVIITSYNNVRKYDNIGTSYVINISVSDIKQLDMAIGEATGEMRGIRKLIATESDNFFLTKSDFVAETFIGLLGVITGSAGTIGLITLIGAAIGLMNIMLVSVNERTREVGLIKAIGGKKQDVRNQFLYESVMISLMGAICGIVLGILVGNFFAMFLGTGFLVPWGWVITGIVICSVVGLLAGIWPAMKAAKLNPIDALRYE